MSVVYIVECEFSIENPNSIIKKVLLQTTEWISLGYDVYIYSLKSNVRYHVNSKIIKVLGDEISKSDSAFRKLTKIWSISKKIKDDLESIRVDIIYTRYLLFTYYFKVVFKRYLVCMEINSNDEVEYEKYSFATKVYNRITKKSLLNEVNGFVCVTNELKDYIAKYSSVRVEVIANGIKYVKRNLHSTNNIPRMVFVASPGNACHGYDILLDLADQLTEYKFDIVGYEGQTRGNVRHYGYLEKKDLENVLMNADFGISALAIERHGMYEACPLKSREYYSYGLPVIGNYIDTDIEDGKYYAHVNSHDIFETATKIRNLVDYWEKVEDRKEKVLIFSEKLLEHKKKEKKRLDFLISL